MNEEIIKKYIAGKTSSKEREDVLKWIDESQQNLQTFSALKADWVFDNLPESEASPEDYEDVKRNLRRRLSAIQIIMRAAAVLFIPLTIFAGYQYLSYSNSFNNFLKSISIDRAVIPKQNQTVVNYSVNPGVKGLIELPDGSSVWLNSSSSLKCPSTFDSTFRMIELSGEGYFKIVSNKDWPMYVKTSKGITAKVTGTEFNLSSYDNDNELKFTLVSGNVTLIRESTKQEIAVNTMEQVIIPDNKKVKGTKGVADVYFNTSWKDGYLVFENTQMDEVIKKMERWYGVKFNVGDADLLTYRFTANFESESITQVLELLKITSNIGYSIKDNNVSLFFR